jgi:LacI family transcriptional regulator
MPKTPSSLPRRVALLVEASRAYARGLVRGVARYNREHERWSVYFAPRGLSDPLPAWLENWRGDGILARIENRRMAEAVTRTGLPAIDLRRALDGLGMPTMGPDDAIVARLAIDHLRGRGFRHFGYFGPWPGVHPALDARRDHFHRLTDEAGFVCSTFRSRRRSNRSWEEELGRIVEWIADLPKPVGVLACNDDYGLQLLDACHRSGVLVPDEVAVVGVGNDDCLCNLSLPPLTSIDLNPQRIGYEAARLLDRMMAGESPPAQHMVVEPRGIQTRRSTDVLATEDEAVIRAVKFIRGHAGQRIQVADVLKHVKMSRASLEPRVKRVLGRTIYQEIQRVQIERVKELLLGSSAPLKQIASQAGFRYPEYMMRVFRQTTGLTPREYRKQWGG